MKQYDVVVIGAGIMGAGMANMLKNYNVLLLEQFAEPAMGTSSKSSKLIHGGLRYLENFEFKLVKECLDERAYLCKHIPHLVKLESFYIPIYKTSKRKEWMVRVGLSIYFLFSKKAFHTVPKSKWKTLDINTKDLIKVYEYKDGTTDDKALTKYVLDNSNAQIEYNAKVTHIKDNQNHCIVSHTQWDKRYDVKAKVVINASGAWVNHILKNTTPKTNIKEIDLVLGSHIFVDTKVDKIYYIEANDKQRAIFVRPYSIDGTEGTLIGTTEQPYKSPRKVIGVPNIDVEYLIANFNSYFKTQISKSGVLIKFSGLRVLLKDDNSAFKKSRQTVIYNDEVNTPNIYTIYGGKLTSFRVSAKKVYKRIKGKINV